MLSEVKSLMFSFLKDEKSKHCFLYLPLKTSKILYSVPGLFILSSQTSSEYRQNCFQ